MRWLSGIILRLGLAGDGLMAVSLQTILFCRWQKNKLNQRLERDISMFDVNIRHSFLSMEHLPAMRTRRMTCIRIVFMAFGRCRLARSLDLDVRFSNYECLFRLPMDQLQFGVGWWIRKLGWVRNDLITIGLFHCHVHAEPDMLFTAPWELDANEIVNGGRTCAYFSDYFSVCSLCSHKSYFNRSIDRNTLLIDKFYNYSGFPNQGKYRTIARSADYRMLKFGGWPAAYSHL